MTNKLLGGATLFNDGTGDNLRAGAAHKQNF